MGKIRTIENSNGKKFVLYGFKVDEGLDYLLALPENIEENSQMLVESYNSGGRQKETYEQNILSAINNGNAIENILIELPGDRPLVLPITPDLIGNPDYQQLSKESITNGNRIDLKFLKCIHAAKEKIFSLSGKKVADKILLNGYSASGVFAQRFALLHPEIIDRCAIGGAAGTIPIPSEDIGYPIGIKDYKELFGKEFNLEAYKNIQFGYYVAEYEEFEPGSYDINADKLNEGTLLGIPAPMHDMSFRAITTDKTSGEKQRNLFGKTMNERYQNSIEYYKNLGIDISGIILRGAYHVGIFNDKMNPSADFLKKQLVRLYLERKNIEKDSVNCVEKMDESFQKARQEKRSQEIIER